MKILIRADASLHIGSGHIMRCLTLANLLRQHGHTVRFLTRAHRGHLGHIIAQQGFDCVLLPEHPSATVSGSLKHAAWLGASETQDFADCAPHIRAFEPDWMICDHYALSAVWQKQVRLLAGCRIMVIDDLHDRAHDAQLLLDQNLGHRAADYAQWISADCRVLSGTRYALLRPEFAAWRGQSLARRQRSGSLNHDAATQPDIFINLGGVDQNNITLNILQSLATSHSGSLNASVMMGQSAPHTDAVQSFAQNAPFACEVQVNAQNMAERMARADWAIGAAGSSAWERCALGLPTLLLVLADNQRSIAAALHNAGAALAFNPADIGCAAWQDALNRFRQTEYLAQMAHRAAALCDGKGAIRVANALAFATQNPHSRLRLAHSDDCARVFDWRNHADIRRWMFHTDELLWTHHAAWFERQLHNPDFKMLIYEDNHVPQGYMSFTRQPENADTWTWGFYTAPHCPRGHGSKMAQLALAWAFNELGAQTILGEVLPHNAASLRLHEKLGFFRLPEHEHIVRFALSAGQCWF